MVKKNFIMRLRPYLMVALVGFAGCSDDKPYIEPTGLLLAFTIISFAISVICTGFLIFSDNKETSSEQRGIITFVGLVFLIVSLLLLFSSRFGGK